MAVIYFRSKTIISNMHQIKLFILYLGHRGLAYGNYGMEYVLTFVCPLWNA